MPSQKNKVVGPLRHHGYGGQGRYGRPQKKKRFRIKFRFGRKFFYLVFGGALLGGIFYFLFISDKFEIKEVKISGLQTVDEERVLEAVNYDLNRSKFGFVKSRNYLVFSGDDMRAFLLESFPKIASVKIAHNRASLNISFAEREATGIWCSADCFYFDKEGFIFEQSPRSFGSLMISIEDGRDVASNLGSVVLTKAQVEIASAASSLMGRNFPFSLRRFVITKDGGYEMLTSEDWRILLDAEADIDYQFSNLKYLLDEEVGNQRPQLEYVDLRLGNRVYYKFKGETVD